MNIKINKITGNKLIFYLTLFFPMINNFFAYFNHGEGLVILYLFFCGIVLIDYMLMGIISKKTIRLNSFILVCMLLFEGVCAYYIAKEVSFISAYLVFVICILLWHLYGNNMTLTVLEEMIIKRRKLVYFVQITYFLLLILSVYSGNGLDIKTWGVISLKGPYSVNHILAYELLMFFIMDLFIWIKLKTLSSMIMAIISMILILLTGVRGVLIPVIIALFVTFMTQTPQKKVILLIVSVAGGVLLLQYTNIFNVLIEKTVNVARRGSITSGRGSIFMSSLNAYREAGSLLKYIGGIGYSGLMEYNSEHIRQTIHAHNDYLDAIAQYGIVGLGVYMASFIRFVKTIDKKAAIIAAMFIASLAFFNGFYMYQSAVFMSPYILVFVKSIDINKLSIRLKERGSFHEYINYL